MKINLTVTLSSKQEYVYCAKISAYIFRRNHSSDVFVHICENGGEQSYCFVSFTVILQFSKCMHATQKRHSYKQRLSYA
jgi:hypothetical protein